MYDTIIDTGKKISYVLLKLFFVILYLTQS